MDNRMLGWKLVMLKALRRNAVWKLNPSIQLHMGQLPILEYIVSNHGCTQQDLCELLRVSPPTITASCKRLEQSGLILRNTDENNRRCNRVMATEEGIRVASECRASFDLIDSITFDSLSPQEREQLAALLDKMIDKLNTKTDGSGLPLVPPWKERNK